MVVVVHAYSGLLRVSRLPLPPGPPRTDGMYTGTKESVDLHI